MKSIKLILFVFIIFSLLGCHQNENELKITCLGNEIDYLRIQDDEINFSSLMTTRLIIKHGEEVKINILRNSGVKIIEFVLNEDGSHKYGKGQLLKTEPKMFLSFQVGYNVDDALSSQLLYPDSPSIRGCVVEYDNKKVIFVYETVVGKIKIR